MIELLHRQSSARPSPAPHRRRTPTEPGLVVGASGVVSPLVGTPGVGRPLGRRRPRSRGVRRPPIAPIQVVARFGGGAAAAGMPVERPYRMSRRARLAVTLTVAAAALVVGTGLALGTWAGPAGAAPAAYTVRTGDSLWTIAESLAPQADIRVVVDEISRLNGLRSVVLQPGQQLLVPAG